jgi:PAS domain S-box-containing protein
MLEAIPISASRKPKGRNSKSKVAPRKSTMKGRDSLRKEPSADYLSDAKFFRLIVENSPNIITIMEKDGRISYNNMSIRRIHSPLKGKVSQRSITSIPHPDDVPEITRMYKAFQKSHGTVDLGVLRIRFKDGLYHHLRCMSREIRGTDGKTRTVIYSSDITAQLESEKALRNSEERYRILADTAPDMIFIVNRKGIIEYVNNASAKEFHVKASNLIGRPLRDFFPSYIYRRQSTSLSKVFESGKMCYVANDTAFPTGQKSLDTWLVPIKDESGKVASVFGISRDVTSYRLIEEELRRRSYDAEKAETRAKIYFDFLAHDIANLISPVLTYSETLLKSDISDPVLEDHLSKIHNQTQRTAKFIMNLRMLVEAEKTPPETSERFDLRMFFIDLEKMVKSQHPGSFLFKLDFPKDKPMEVLGGMHIRNAFMQGFSHAMEEHFEPGLRVNVKIVSIKRHSRPFWQVRMEMPGRHMSESWREKAVTPFDPAHRAKGVSLESISFAASVINHFGGTLRDESLDYRDPSKGHAIVIELPKAGSWRSSRNT